MFVYVSYWHTGPRCCQRLRCKKLLNEVCVKWFGSSGKKEAIWKECRIGKVVGPLNSMLVWNESAMLRGHMLIVDGHSRRQHIHSRGLNYCRRKIPALLSTGNWCFSLSWTIWSKIMLPYLILAKYKGSILCILHDCVNPKMHCDKWNRLSNRLK